MKTKSKKTALLMSFTSLLICFAMLVGSTFAWFTDTASTGVNKIVSGKLKVDIVGETGDTHLDTLNFTKAAGAEDEQLLWEPGCRYLTEGFRIANKGNLALKWKAQVNKDSITDGKVEGSTIAKDGMSLLNVIDFYVVTKAADGTETEVAIEDFIGNLGKDAKSKVYYIKGVMQTTAGNDYQDLTLEGIGITVYATQDTVENDSFDNQYDRFAAYAPSGKSYIVKTHEEAKSAFAAGGSIIINDYLQGDATKTAVSDRLVIKYPSVIELNGAIHVPGSLEDSDNWAEFFINADTTINAAVGGGISCNDKVGAGSSGYIGGPYVAHVNGENIVVTVNGGVYHGGGTVFNVEKGTLIVNGGSFQVTPDVDTKDYRYTLNCIDANYKNGSAKIIVKGGTFVNFDPSNNLAEGENTNFVAPGYKVISETQSNGDIYYTVVAE